MKQLRLRKKKYPYFRTSVLTAVLVVLINTLFFTAEEGKRPIHSAAPTFTVCHAIPKQETSKFAQEKGERYFCSNDGCYSDNDEEMSVIGTYEDGNTCAGIAKNLHK